MNYIEENLFALFIFQ